MNDDVLVPSLGALIALDPNFTPCFIHIGNGKWEAMVIMRDCGGHLEFADSGLHLYRGPKILGTESPPLFAYGFHPDAVSQKTTRQATWTGVLGWIKQLFGRGASHPTPWIDTHPIYQGRRLNVDLLLQTTDGRPKWNRFKSLTPAGDAWLREHTRGDDFVRIKKDGIPAVVHPKDYGMLAADAEADGLSVWIH